MEIKTTNIFGNLIILFLLFNFNLKSQIPNFEPEDIKTPTSTQLFKLNEIRNVGNTGAPEISIPIYEIKTRSLNLPISISYDASGIRVANEPGNIGQNWSLIAGGMINQTVRSSFDGGSASNYYSNAYSEIMNGFAPDIFGPAGSPPPADYILANNISAGSIDGAPDLFSYNIPNENGQFINLNSGGIVLIPKKDLLIESTNSIGTANPIYSNLHGYKITSSAGIEYYFDELEVSTTPHSTTQGAQKASIVYY